MKLLFIVCLTLGVANSSGLKLEKKVDPKFESNVRGDTVSFSTSKDGKAIRDYEEIQKRPVENLSYAVKCCRWLALTVGFLNEYLGTSVENGEEPAKKDLKFCDVEKGTGPHSPLLGSPALGGLSGCETNLFGISGFSVDGLQLNYQRVAEFFGVLSHERLNRECDTAIKSNPYNYFEYIPDMKATIFLAQPLRRTWETKEEPPQIASPDLVKDVEAVLQICLDKESMGDTMESTEYFMGFTCLEVFSMMCLAQDFDKHGNKEYRKVYWFNFDKKEYAHIIKNREMPTALLQESLFTRQKFEELGKSAICGKVSKKIKTNVEEECSHSAIDPEKYGYGTSGTPDDDAYERYYEAKRRQAGRTHCASTRYLYGVYHLCAGKTLKSEPKSFPAVTFQKNLQLPSEESVREFQNTLENCQHKCEPCAKHPVD